MEYEHVSHDKDRFSLHDCKADHISYEGKKLRFCFPDGIWYMDFGDDWPNTGKAAVEFQIDGFRGITFYGFEKQNGIVVRKEYSVEELMEKVNAGEWQLEFAYRYDGFEEIFYSCWIWREEEPWSFEAQLFIGTKEETLYFYDDPRE